jgi:hypothetical protein
MSAKTLRRENVLIPSDVIESHRGVIVLRRRKLAIWAAAAIVGAGILVAVWVYRKTRVDRVAVITGAVLEDNADPNKQLPVENAVIGAKSSEAAGESRSDASGLFRVTLSPPVYAGEPVRMTFQHPGYEPLETTTSAGGQIHIIRLTPKSRKIVSPSERTPVSISDLRVRYAMKTTTTLNVGSTVKTFEVVNTGNVPCDHKSPCSPDGKWKAAVTSQTLDAGDEKQFRNVRISCIAGPCPFTRIDSDGYSRGGRVIKVSVRNWSDTVTFLLEAEVTHTMVSDMIRHSFPFIFDRSMNFTLPATAQGPSIEAEVNGVAIVYPLGPSLKLSWAICSMELSSDGTKLYRCELKPEYQFR